MNTHTTTHARAHRECDLFCNLFSQLYAQWKTSVFHLRFDNGNEFQLYLFTFRSHPLQWMSCFFSSLLFSSLLASRSQFRALHSHVFANLFIGLAHRQTSCLLFCMCPFGAFFFSVMSKIWKKSKRTTNEWIKYCCWYRECVIERESEMDDVLVNYASFFFHFYARKYQLQCIFLRLIRHSHQKFKFSFLHWASLARLRPTPLTTNSVAVIAILTSYAYNCTFIFWKGRIQWRKMKKKQKKQKRMHQFSLISTGGSMFHRIFFSFFFVEIVCAFFPSFHMHLTVTPLNYIFHFFSVLQHNMIFSRLLFLFKDFFRSFAPCR